MDDCSVQQIQVINYLEKAIESQPRWIQRLFEKEKIFFTVGKDDLIGLQFTNKVDPIEKEVITSKLKQYMEENPCEVSKDGAKEILN